MIRVLIVEDSAVTREYLAYLVAQDPALQVVGVARDGLEAVEHAVRLRPDVILMDVHMPRMDGFEATRRIMADVPTPIVMATATFDQDETAMAFVGIEAGALTLIGKPGGPTDPSGAESARQLLTTLKLMAGVKVIRRWPKRPSAPTPPPRRPPSAGRVRLVAMGASTGGPQAVAEVLSGLPADLGAPLLLVQHIARGFTAGLVEWLGRGTRLRVKLGEPGEAMQPGTVYVAPEGRQMGPTTEGRIRLTTEEWEDGFRPSASYLFQSAAESYGSAAIGVLLTGMGRDGASGLLRLRHAAGLTMAQDEETSVVFGMPGEAIQLGAAEYILPLDRIGAAIRAVVAGQ